MDKKIPFRTAILLLSGVILLSLSVLIGKFSSHPTGVIGEEPSYIEALEGKAKILRKNEAIQLTTNSQTSLNTLDTIETGHDASALIDLAKGTSIKLKPNSKITVQFQENEILLFVKTGGLELSRNGNSKLYVVKDGKKLTLNDYLVSGRTTALTPKFIKKSNKLISPLSDENQVINPDLIQETLSQNRSQFFKCYAQLLQRSPNAKGESSLNFTIENSGKVIDPQVTRSNLGDLPFERCLTRTLERIEFTSFAGESVMTVFPIRFE